MFNMTKDGNRGKISINHRVWFSTNLLVQTDEFRLKTELGFDKLKIIIAVDIVMTDLIKLRT